MRRSFSWIGFSADYGPETKVAREQLRDTVAAVIQMIWAEQKSDATGLDDYERLNGMETVQMTLLKITPATEAQRQLYATAQSLVSELRESRWLLIEQGRQVIPVPFLVLLLFWLTRCTSASVW